MKLGCFDKNRTCVLRLSAVCSTVELRSNIRMERPVGFEPTIPTWKDRVLPLHYERIKLVRAVGFEPTTTRLQTEDSGQTELCPESKKVVVRWSSVIPRLG